MIVEDVEFRVWAALRLVDAVTRLAIEGPLRVRGEGQIWQRNISRLWVLRELHAPADRRAALAAYESSFELPVASAPPVSILVRIDDPRGRWLSRRAALTLPRDPNAAAGAVPPLLSTVDVPLYPAPSAPLAAPWAILRAHVKHEGKAAEGCVITVHEPEDATRVLGRGQSDARGEALVAVPGVPVHIPGGGESAFTSERAARATIVFQASTTVPPLPPDTDALADAAGLGVLRKSVDVVIASGRMTTLEVSLP